MKTFAPLIIFFLAVGVITVIGMVYEGRWRENRLRKDHVEERRRARSQSMRNEDAEAAAEDEP